MDRKYSEAELNSFNKAALISLFLSMQTMADELTGTVAAQKEQLNLMNQKLDLLLEQLNISKQHQFGRSSEKIDFAGQLNLEEYFNEAEAIITNKYVLEPELERITPSPYTRQKAKGKREEDLKDLPVRIIPHELSEEELLSRLGPKWKRLPDEVYKRLAFHPASFEVEEHHVAVYAGMDGQTIIRGNRPADLLRNSIATPSLEAAIMNSKYVNAIPLYRISQEFLRNDIHISKQVMANWMIQCGDRYLGSLYDRLHKEMYMFHVLQADETPVNVSKDGRPANSKSFMWVYRTGKMYVDTPIILYEYQKTRKSDHPKEFFQNFEGVVVCDGYSAYQKLDRENPSITFAGCWTHARRPFAEALKAIPKDKKESARETIAYQAIKQIAAIYHLDNELSDLSPQERQKMRQITIKPLVEAFFVWSKGIKDSNQLSKGKTLDGINYCINHEVNLRVFLEDGEVPMDNNSTEGALRSFCLHKRTWKLIDTIEGAKSSAIIYSITETAKANNLNPFRYLEYVLSEIMEHQDDKDQGFLDNLLPWSVKLPEICRSKTIKSKK